MQSVPPPKVTARSGLRALHRDLRRGELQLLHHELAVEAHARAVDLLPEPGEQLERRLVHDLRADLLEDRHRLRVNGVERVLGEDRERGFEHAADCR